MKRILILAATAAMLAACADETTEEVVVEPVDPVVDPDPTTAVPVELTRGDLDGGALAENGITVQITLDGGETVDQVYANRVGGNGVFDIYQLDEGTTGRLFTAIGGESADGELSAIVASDGGQFNRFLGGATVNQNTYTAPAGGTVDYAGGYQGLLNFGNEFREGVPGSDSATAVRSYVVDGNVFLKADFTDGVVNGAIFGRQYEDRDGTQELPELVLIVGDITSDGAFGGVVELNDADLTGVGQYGGAFGGTGATSAAGLIELADGFLGTRDALDENGDPIPDDENPGEFEQVDIGNGNEREYGVFILEPASAGR